jgi:hypothetical protein
LASGIASRTKNPLNLDGSVTNTTMRSCLKIDLPGLAIQAGLNPLTLLAFKTTPAGFSSDQWWIPQAASRFTDGVPVRHRFDLNQETEATRPQDSRPAKIATACFDHKASLPYEIGAATAAALFFAM